MPSAVLNFVRDFLRSLRSKRKPIRRERVYKLQLDILEARKVPSAVRIVNSIQDTAVNGVAGELE